MIDSLVRGGLIIALLQVAQASVGFLQGSMENEKCGASVKGGIGKWPANTGDMLNTFFVDQEDGIEAAILKCSALCCQSYSSSYPCDLAFLDFKPADSNDPTLAICAHYNCYNEYNEYICQFRNEPNRVDWNGERIINYASWVYAFSNDLQPLIDDDVDKVNQALKVQGNLTGDNGDGIGTFKVEETIRRDRGLDEGERELVAMAKGAVAQSEIDEKKADSKMVRILTPLLVVAMVLLLGVATLTFKYKKLKKTIRYDGIKDADYYTKLDPADMAAEQEAQALINGAYDI